MHERTLIPSLFGDYQAGEHWLGCAVVAHPEAAKGEKLWGEPVEFSQICEDMKKIWPAVG